MFKLKVAEKAVKRQISDLVKQGVDQYRLRIEKEIKRKTLLYALWSLVGVFLLLFVPKSFFYIFSSGMIILVIFINWNFIKSLKTVFNFIKCFDEKIKEFVAQKIKSIEDQSVKNRIGFWLSGQDNRDIEDFCIAYFIRELVQQIKKYKWSLIIRILTSIIVFLLLKEIFF